MHPVESTWLAWRRWPPPPDVEGWIWALRRIGRPGIDPERYDRARPLWISRGLVTLPEGQLVPFASVGLDWWVEVKDHPPPLPHTPELA